MKATDCTITLYDEVLSEVVQKHSKVVFNYPKEKIWNQKGASLRRRIDAEPSLKGRVDKVLQAKNLKRYIVPEDDTAPVRCIDGRITVGWEKDAALQQDTLGPKIAGGTVYAALAYRIVDTEHLHAKLRFEEDISHVAKRCKEIGIGIGGHTGNNQSGFNTGCGAVDNIDLVLDCLQRPEYQQQLRGLAKLILGDAYDNPGLVDELIGRMLYLDALKPSYMPKEHNDPDGAFLYKKTVVQTLRTAANRSREVVPALDGSHNEIAAILNFVPGTTFDTDRFSHDNKNEIQVFAWDVWHTYKEAERLYTYDTPGSIEQQRQAADNRIKYVVARALLGISTMMVLTDGSLRLAAVTASED